MQYIQSVITSTIAGFSGLKLIFFSGYHSRSLLIGQRAVPAVGRTRGGETETGTAGSSSHHDPSQDKDAEEALKDGSPPVHVSVPGRREGEGEKQGEEKNHETAKGWRQEEVQKQGQDTEHCGYRRGICLVHHGSLWSI